MPRCEVLSGCIAPSTLLMMSDGLGCAYVESCAPHIVDIRRAGFLTTAISGMVDVSAIVPRWPLNYRELSSSDYSEVAVAPRDWCSNSCKILAKLIRSPHGIRVKYVLSHSATYGCPAGLGSRIPYIKEIAATGHIVGEVYADHHWGGIYTVLAAHDDGTVSVQTPGERIRRHRTPLEYKSDHLISQWCTTHTECINRQKLIA